MILKASPLYSLFSCGRAENAAANAASATVRPLFLTAQTRGMLPTYAVWDSKGEIFLGMIFGYKLQATELDSSICRHILNSSCFGAARASCKRPRADVDGGGASRAASRGPGPPT